MIINNTTTGHTACSSSKLVMDAFCNGEKKIRDPYVAFFLYSPFVKMKVGKIEYRLIEKVDENGKIREDTQKISTNVDVYNEICNMCKDSFVEAYVIEQRFNSTEDILPRKPFMILCDRASNMIPIEEKIIEMFLNQSLDTVKNSNLQKVSNVIEKLSDYNIPATIYNLTNLGIKDSDVFPVSSSSKQVANALMKTHIGHPTDSLLNILCSYLGYENAVFNTCRLMDYEVCRYIHLNPPDRYMEFTESVGACLSSAYNDNKVLKRIIVDFENGENVSELRHCLFNIKKQINDFGSKTEVILECDINDLFMYNIKDICSIHKDGLINSVIFGMKNSLIRMEPFIVSQLKSNIDSKINTNSFDDMCSNIDINIISNQVFNTMQFIRGPKISIDPLEWSKL